MKPHKNKSKSKLTLRRDELSKLQDLYNLDQHSHVLIYQFCKNFAKSPIFELQFKIKPQQSIVSNTNQNSNSNNNNNIFEVFLENYSDPICQIIRSCEASGQTSPATASQAGGYEAARPASKDEYSLISLILCQSKLALAHAYKKMHGDSSSSLSQSSAPYQCLIPNGNVGCHAVINMLRFKKLFNIVNVESERNLARFLFRRKSSSPSSLNSTINEGEMPENDHISSRKISSTAKSLFSPNRHRIAYTFVFDDKNRLLEINASINVPFDKYFRLVCLIVPVIIYFECLE